MNPTRTSYEMALQLVGDDGEVVLISMVPNNERNGLNNALAMGADSAILVSDDALSGSDALSTAKVLAAAIQRTEPDLVLAEQNLPTVTRARFPSKLQSCLVSHLSLSQKKSPLTAEMSL